MSVTKYGSLYTHGFVYKTTHFLFLSIFCLTVYKITLKAIST